MGNLLYLYDEYAQPPEIDLWISNLPNTGLYLPQGFPWFMGSRKELNKYWLVWLDWWLKMLINWLIITYANKYICFLQE